MKSRAPGPIDCTPVVNKVAQSDQKHATGVVTAQRGQSEDVVGDKQTKAKRRKDFRVLGTKYRDLFPRLCHVLLAALDF